MNTPVSGKCGFEGCDNEAVDYFVIEINAEILDENDFIEMYGHRYRASPELKRLAKHLKIEERIDYNKVQRVWRLPVCKDHLLFLKTQTAATYPVNVEVTLGGVTTALYSEVRT